MFSGWKAVEVWALPGSALRQVTVAPDAMRNPHGAKRTAPPCASPTMSISTGSPAIANLGKAGPASASPPIRKIARREITWQQASHWQQAHAIARRGRGAPPRPDDRH